MSQSLQSATANTLVRSWEAQGDSRKINLYRTGNSRLMLQVFDRTTNGASHRFLRSSGPDYERELLASMHPELANNETGKPCAAVFIDNGLVQLGKSYGGERGEVEVRLLR